MSRDSNLQFIQEKIEDIRSALFYSMSDAVLKIPTSIVTALKVDEVGNVWFFVNKPMQYIAEFDKEFPARLEFFKKGKHYFLKIMGKASIVNDPEEVNGLVSLPEDIKTKAMGQLVLVKVKIQNVDYHETLSETRFNWFQTMRTRVNKWLFNEEPGYRPYKLNQAA